MLNHADTRKNCGIVGRGSYPFGPHDGRLQISALDGGGAKELFTAYVLADLEDELGISIADRFDLVAGTSAGGPRLSRSLLLCTDICTRVLDHGRAGRFILSISE